VLQSRWLSLLLLSPPRYAALPLHGKAAPSSLKDDNTPLKSADFVQSCVHLHMPYLLRASGTFCAGAAVPFLPMYLLATCTRSRSTCTPPCLLPITAHGAPGVLPLTRYLVSCLLPVLHLTAGYVTSCQTNCKGLGTLLPSHHDDHRAHPHVSSSRTSPAFGLSPHSEFALSKPSAVCCSSACWWHESFLSFNGAYSTTLWIALTNSKTTTPSVRQIC
jgi:hypothetical protein